MRYCVKLPLVLLALCQIFCLTATTSIRDDSFRNRQNITQGDEMQSEESSLIERDSTEASSDDDSDMYLEPEEGHNSQQDATSSEVVSRYEYGIENVRPDNQGFSQHFFPSFAPIFSLGHSRPPQLYHQVDQPQQQFYKQPPPRPPQFLRAEFNPFRSTYKETPYQVPLDTDEGATTALQSNLLGSGNFGVLKGGTFFNEGDKNNYFNNGHSRPLYGNPRPQKYTGGDFFENFRDFADINTPTKASFSEYVIVYVNQNGSRTDVQDGENGEVRPKNIIEQLNLIDKQEKKLSNHKRKLARYQEEKEKKLQKVKRKEVTKDLQEPLLALS